MAIEINSSNRACIINRYVENIIDGLDMRKMEDMLHYYLTEAISQMPDSELTKEILEVNSELLDYDCCTFGEDKNDHG
jgi:hypothetical protein